MIPLFIYVTPEYNLLGGWIFALASITDFLDGYLARRSGQITTFGIIVDPIADKFLVIAALILLVDMGRMSVIPAVIIIAREFLVTALRVVALSKDIVIKAEMGGKLKVGAQITAVLCLIVMDQSTWILPLDWLVALVTTVLGVSLFDIGTAALWISVVLGIVSGVQYTIMFWNKTVGSGDKGGQGEGI